MSELPQSNYARMLVVRSPDDKKRKALKLIEALSEECNVKTDGDHAWRTCRACLAREELDHKGVRQMLRDLLAAIRLEGDKP
jgi:diphthamide synthase subunit DPH2